MNQNQTFKVLSAVAKKKDFFVSEIPIKQLGTRDLRVRIEAVSVNPADYKVIQSAAQNEQKTPLIVGFDAAGTIIEIGSEVKGFKVGDQVIYAGDYNRDGSFAESQIVDERIVGRKPFNLSWNDAAAIPLVGLTAYEGLVEILGIKEENFIENQKKSILIVGGAGGVGSAAIQISKKLLGLKVIATASRPESKSYCLKLGADHIINHKNNLEGELNAKGLAGKVDYIFNTSDMTTAYFNQFVNIINPFSGIVGINGFTEPLNLAPTFMKRVSVSIECMFSKTIFGINLESQGKILQHLAQKLSEGVISSLSNQEYTFDIDTIKLGLEACEKGQNIGKITYSKVQDFFTKQK